MPKLLIVVDFQRDFVDGALGFPGAAALDSRIAEKIEGYRKAGDQILFTFDTHGKDYMYTQEGKNLPVPHCEKGSEGWKLYGQVAKAYREGDVCLEKCTFGSDLLLSYLKEHPFDSIELVGVVSNICVISNAVIAKAAQPETPVVVDARCVGSGDEALHNKALDVMEGLQIEIINR